MQDYGLKQEHGGGDDVDKEAPLQEKKIKLDKYLIGSDYSIVDFLEKLLVGCRRKQDLKEEIEKIKHERMTLLRMGIKMIEEGAPYLDMKRNEIAYCLLKIILDQEWKPLFKMLIMETYNRKTKHPLSLLVALNQIYGEKKEIMDNYLAEFIGDIDNEEALAIVSELHNPELSRSLKKYLILIARDDIGKNKEYAIHTLAIILDDEDVIKLFKYIIKSFNEEGKSYVLHAIATMGKDKGKKLEQELKELNEKTRNAYLKTLIKRILR